MARIDPIPLREWPPSMRESLAAMAPADARHPQPRTEGRPKALNTLGTLAHHPHGAKAFFTLNGHVLRTTLLSERQRELLVLRTAARRDCRYEWFQHVVVGRDVGLSDDEIARIETDPTSPEWDELDGALLRSVDELIDDGELGDDTWATLCRHFGPDEVLDVIFTIGIYEMLAWIMRSFDLPLDEDLIEILGLDAGAADA